jgi:hypothetical protein
VSSAAWEPVAVGEEAAIYGYGVLTAQLSGTERAMALAALDAHRVARDRARGELAQEGLNPPVAAAFELPTLTSAAGAKMIAAALEIRLTDLYVALAGETQGEDRSYASQTSQETTSRAVMWGWEPAAFPSAVAQTQVVTEPPNGPVESVSSPNDGAKLE